MNVNCLICGQPFDPAAIDLIDAFGRYLMLVFLVTCAVRFRTYRQSLSFFLRLPREWPQLFALAKQHRGVFMAWMTLVPVGVTLLMLGLHTLCVYVIWKEASITAEQIAAAWQSAPLVLLSGAAMLLLDGSALFGAGTVDFDKMEKDLNRGERVLSRRASWTVRALSLGLVSTKKIVGKRVHSALAQFNLAIIEQMRWWALQTAVRMLFGFSLWLAWAVSIGAMAPLYYWLIVTATVVLLAILAWRTPLAKDSDG